MKKNSKLFAVLTLFALVCVIFITSFALSAFSVNTQINAGYGSGKVEYTVEEVVVSGNTTFAKPGDSITKPFKLKNTGDTPFSYTMSINYSRSVELLEGEIGIENAIFVYVDGEYQGLLCDFTPSHAALNTKNALAPTDQVEHKIKFEYHIDAGTDYNNEITLDVKLKGALALNASSDYIFVNNYNALQQYARKNNYQGRTIVLTDDIKLEKNVIINLDCKLNLNSHTLDLNGHELIFSGTSIKEVVKIVNRIDADSARTGKGYITTGGKSASKIIVNTPNGLVLDYTNCNVMTLVDGGYSKELLYTEYSKYFNAVIRNGLTDDMIVTDGFMLYFQNHGMGTPLRLTSNIDNLAVVQTTSTVTLDVIKRLDYTQDAIVAILTSFAAADVHVRVWGNSDESLIEQYLTTEIGFISNFSEEKQSYIISSDIYLPSRIQKLGATIEWKSSRPTVVSTMGKTVRPYKNVESDLEITAFVTFNNVTYIRSFALFVPKKTAEDILKEIIYDLECNLTFAYVFEAKNNENVRELFTEEDYAERGVTKLEYLDMAASYASIFTLDRDEPSLTLMHDTVITKAFLGLKIEVTDGEVVEASGEAQIRIETSQSSDIFDIMYNHLLTYTSHIEKNTLDSFETPVIYMDQFNTYKYYIYPGKTQIPDLENEFTENPLDVNSYATVSSDHKRIIIDKYNLPNENTTITILVELESNGQKAYRTFKIELTGILLLKRDILDDNLFYYLRQLIDENVPHGNKDGLISRDEIDAVGLTSLTRTESYITSVVGLEYFKTLTNINLSNNLLTDISPLAQLYNLDTLNLANNRIINISKIETLTNLITLNLSANEITDISNLVYLESLRSLYLNNNLAISDLSPIANMKNLSFLTIYSTESSNATTLKFNLNYLITQYDRIGSSASFYVVNSSTRWTPTADQRAANNIVNYIEKIEEIGSVIILPYEITYGGVTYPIYWENSESSNGIITIDEANHRAYVNQPIADLDITLYAYIKYGNDTIMYRVMDILSHKISTVLTLILSDGTVLVGDEVTAAIPDPVLLQYLFTTYSTSANTIDIPALIAANANGEVDLTSQKIKSFDGIEYFKDIITSLNVSNINISDYSPIAELKNLTSFRATTGTIDIAKFTDFSKLNYFYVYGCKYINANGTDMDEYNALRNLYLIYKNNQVNSIRVFQEDSSTVWNPYIVPTRNSLTSLQSLYMVAAGSPFTFPAEFIINMYDVEDIVVGHSTAGAAVSGAYRFTLSMANGTTTNAPTLGISIALVGGRYTVTLPYNKVTSIDTYAYITVTLTIANASTGITVITNQRLITILQLANPLMHIELADGSFALLSDVVKNRALCEQIIQLYGGIATVSIDGKNYPYISRQQILNVTSIKLDGYDHGKTQGIEQFYGSTKLTTITFDKFMSPGYASIDYVTNLKMLTATNFPALTTLNFTNSYVDTADLVNLSNLTTLSITDSLYTNLDSAAFAGMENLKSVTILNANVYDFKAIASLKRVTDLYIYNNPASSLKSTDGYVAIAYGNASAAVPGAMMNYYITSANFGWVPSSVTNVSDYEVIMTSSTGTVLNIDEIGYANGTSVDSLYGINYIVKGTIIYLPTSYGGAPIEWTSSASDYILQIGSVVTYNGGQYYKVVANAYNVKTYARIYGTCYGKVLIYPFVIDGTSSTYTYDPVNEGYVQLIAPVDAPANIKNLADSTTNRWVVDLNAFMIDGVVEDPVFMNAMLEFTNGFKTRVPVTSSTTDGVTTFTYGNPIAQSNFTGVFIKTQTASLWYEGSLTSGKPSSGQYGARIQMYFTNTASSMNYAHFTSIRGIKIFFAITVLYLGYHEFTDISEIRFLTSLSTLSITESQVTTLWYEKDSTSIFKNLTSLSTLSLSGCRLITDYAPISCTDKTMTTPRNELRRLVSITIAPESTWAYDGTENIQLMLSMRLAALPATNITTLNLANSVSSTNLPHQAAQACVEFFDYQVPTQSFRVGDTLPAAIFGSSEKTVQWQVATSTTSTTHLVAIDASGKITADSSNIEGPVFVDIYFLQGTVKVMYRRVAINMTSDGRKEATKIALTQAEGLLFTGTTLPFKDYYPAGSVTNENGQYYVTAAAAIPDAGMRGSLYAIFDMTDNISDGIISLTERNTAPASNTLTFTWRNIKNMKGLELFPNVTTVYLYGNYITSIPELIFPTANRLTSLYFGSSGSYGNARLADIKNLHYDADGSGTAYKSLAYSLTLLDISGSRALFRNQLIYLTNTDFDRSKFPNPVFKNNFNALTTLRIQGVYFLDYYYTQWFPRTLTAIPGVGPNSTNNGNVAANQGGALVYWDKFLLGSTNNATVTNSKRLSTTSLQKEIPFAASYAIDAGPIALPTEINFQGERFKLGYAPTTLTSALGDKDFYTITQSGDIYYITIKPGAPETLSIDANTLFDNPKGTGWTKGYIESVTINAGSPDGEAGFKVATPEGEIQLDSGGPFEDMRKYFVDPYLRYHLMNIFDGIGTSNPRDGRISYTELMNNTSAGGFGYASFNFTIGASAETGRNITDLTGIEQFAKFNPSTMSIYNANISDYSPLAVFQSVKDLTIRNSIQPVYDLSFVNTMPNLIYLNLYDTLYTNMNFLHENRTLERLNTINRGKSFSVDAQFVRTEWAYARANGSLSENESYMISSTVTPLSYVSTASMKIAAYVLNTLNFSLDTALPDSTEYNGQIYGNIAGGIENTEIRWVSISPGIDIIDNIAVSNGKRPNGQGAVLAILEYQGMFYERLFIVDC